MKQSPLGLESGVVRLVEYDPGWAALFAAEAQRIRAECGALPLHLEHVGGTSIPGMCAKPVLDTAAAYHVHLVEEGGPLWRDYPAFRNYLRAHADAAREFADLKRALATRFPRDREAYINGKSEPAREILKRAAGAA